MDISRFMQALRQGAIDPHWAALYHGGKGSTPPTPDYTGAAEKQSDASKEIALQQTYANRPNVYTPFGTETWTPRPGADPTTGQAVTNWDQNIVLGPEQQASLDAQNRIQTGKSQAAETLLGQATGAFQKPFDWAGQPEVGSLDDAQKNAYTKMSAMLEPGRTQQRDALQTRLANSGLGLDTEAYRRAQMGLGEQFSQEDKSVLSQAMAEGRADVGTSATLRQQGIAEEAQRRGMTLNELNALLTGQQVNTPQMPSFSPASAGQAPNYLGAAGSQGQFGMDQANLSNANSAATGQAIGTAATVVIAGVAI